ncbi:MAG: hypothetical protein AB7V16_09415 [Vulcanibacillus sp.]
MQLQLKKIPKIVKPISVIDKTFESQGFKKTIKKDYSYYHLSIYDNITKTRYELRIPFQIIYPCKKESVYRIKEVVLFTNSPRLQNSGIPKAIINAAYEKLYEIFPYLNMT